MHKIIILLLLLCCASIAGCNPDTIDTPIYEGENLEIGVIGTAPEVREKIVSFTQVTFEQMQEQALSADFDAIFIMKDQLLEADNPKYAKVYTSSKVPFFFIESRKSFMPFTIEDLSYEEVPDQPGSYATGYFQTDTNYRYWQYGLYNDMMNDLNIKDAYSRIFSTVESLKTALK